VKENGMANRQKQGETPSDTKSRAEFKSSGVEGTKDTEKPDVKKHVTCEDVIKKMRAKGKKI
jgi:hypothetical protein